VNSASHWNQSGRRWVSKALIFSLSAGVVGMSAGTLLGFTGALLPEDARVAVASLCALLAIVVGGLELSSRGVRLIQRNRETPQNWLQFGALRWGLINGGALGLGAITRLGFALWYTVPLGALLVGDPIRGAALYGTYGFVRGAMAWGIVLGMFRLTRSEPSDVWLLRHALSARLVSGGCLVALGTATAILVGF
jgi:hypothetical protein